MSQVTVSQQEKIWLLDRLVENLFASQCDALSASQVISQLETAPPHCSYQQQLPDINECEALCQSQ